MFLALGIQNVMRMRYIVIWDLFDSAGFFHVMSYVAQFKKKKLNINILFDFLYKVCLKRFLL